MYNHIRKAICAKSNRISKIDAIDNTVKIITFNISMNDQNANLQFQN